MNCLFILIGTFLIYIFMIMFYKYGKKDGLFIYIALLSSLLGIVMYEIIDVFSFQTDLGISLVISIFICSNIIIQRYGTDETGRIIKYYIFPYIFVNIILSIFTLVNSSDYNINVFDNLFGYNLNNIRVFIGYLLSIGFMLWYNSYMYYYLRKSKNKLLFSNIGSILIIQFIESIIFVFVAYVGLIDFNLIFGIIVIRYILKVIVGFIGLIPISVILKLKDK